MAKQSKSDSLLAERLFAERALRELTAIRQMSHPQALRWLNALILDIRRAEGEFPTSRGSIAAARDEAILAIGLVGIALAGQPNPPSELPVLWDRAASQTEKWYGAISSRQPTSAITANIAQHSAACD